MQDSESIRHNVASDSQRNFMSEERIDRRSEAISQTFVRMEESIAERGQHVLANNLNSVRRFVEGWQAKR